MARSPGARDEVTLDGHLDIAITGTTPVAGIPRPIVFRPSLNTSHASSAASGNGDQLVARADG